MRQNSYRVLSHEDRRIINTINSEISQFRDQLSPINYGIQDVDEHITDRINDRSIWARDVNLVISYLLKNKLCQLIYNCETDGRAFIKFAIVYDTDFIILCTCRTVRDNMKLIKFNSVIQYKEDQVYQGFVMKLNRLVRKTTPIQPPQDNSWDEYVKNLKK